MRVVSKNMFLTQTKITLKNAGDLMAARRGYIEEPEVREITVNALVDTGAWTMVINEATRKRLGLDFIDIDTDTHPKNKYNLAGPLEVRWKDRRTTCEAIVLPDSEDILIGSVPLEAMDLTVNPYKEIVGVHRDQIMRLIS